MFTGTRETLEGSSTLEYVKKVAKEKAGLYKTVREVLQKKLLAWKE